MFAVSDLVFAFGIVDFIARAAIIDKVDRPVLKTMAKCRSRVSQASGCGLQRVGDNAFHLPAPL
jgi:hypothetical protein